MNAEKTTEIINLIKDYFIYANNFIWEEEDYIKLITYSGRCMYGAECYAIEAQGVDSYQELLSDIEEYAGEREITIDRDVFRALRNARKDSLGYNNVYYCPSLTKVDGLEP